MPQATKPAGFVLAPQQLSHVTKDVLSQLAGKEAMVRSGALFPAVLLLCIACL